MKIDLLRPFLYIMCWLSPVSMAFASAVAASPTIHEDRLSDIDEIVESAIRAGQIPGAVVLVGTEDSVVYRKAFGYRALAPRKETMTADTIFDLSSLTKVISTTTAILQLAEKGKIRIEDPASDYWPEFKSNGKEYITIRQLLTHYSGLRPDIDLKPDWSGHDNAVKKVLREKPVSQPGTKFIYSDINFIVLGELVSRISGQTLDAYCAESIFKPMMMKDTMFNPQPPLRTRIAPTQYKNRNTGELLRGEVHDPSASRMGGVSGHAGLFSTVDDLSIFAQMLLKGGSVHGTRILSPLTVEKMTSPQSPPDKMILRGLGWDIDSPFSCNRGFLFPVGSYGHTGYTGTSIWIDPVSKVYIIILTNRVHPHGHGSADFIRSGISTVVASSLDPLTNAMILDGRRSLTGYSEIMKSYRIHGDRNGRVETGIDILEAEGFACLEGKNVGLITNHSGRDAMGKSTVELLFKAPRVKLRAIFSPEHGFSGGDEGQTDDFVREPVTGLPVYSLYGRIKRPSDSVLKGMDALVFDVQDAGVRFYTYITTLAYTMEAAAKNGVSFYVLDRPNPISASIVQGPTPDKDLRSFVNYFPMPIRHGMTVGELAQMFKAENRIDVDLHVVRMRGYERGDWFDETGLTWVNPSPNIRTLTEAVLYPGVAMVEGANVSVGRGTNIPFELLGSPWVDAKELSEYLNKRKIQGVRFMPAEFTPSRDRFKNELCRGVQIILIDRRALDPAALGVEIISALYRLFPKAFEIDKTLDLIGTRWLLQAIKNGEDPNAIVRRWQDSLKQFLDLRSKYLLY
ncbi:MAG: exo-beta-N-acetylmuramidase NamZ domain-containing protein [Nitrospirota bacterium]